MVRSDLGLMTFPISVAFLQRRAFWSAVLVLGLGFAPGLRAQDDSKNEIVLAFGATVTPSVGVQGGKIDFDVNPHFTPSYYHRFKTAGNLGIYGGVGVALSPRDVTVSRGPAATYRQAAYAFVTPAILVKFREKSAINPWLTVGGGWSDFLISRQRLGDAKIPSGGKGPGSFNTNTGVGVFGAGVDFTTPFKTPIIHKRIGFRLEIKDYLSGRPDYGVKTSGSTQNFVLIGGGIIFKL